MAYKTFSARGKTTSWSNRDGNCITLYGGIYGYKTSKTFRKIKCLVLCENLPPKESQKVYGDEYWFVKADTATIQRTEALFAEELKWFQQPEIIIEGKGKTVNSITPYMGASGE
jgi:hypothetical protein